jgi:hypothetical protein
VLTRLVLDGNFGLRIKFLGKEKPRFDLAIADQNGVLIF